jgi:heptosyltransferase-2
VSPPAAPARLLLVRLHGLGDALMTTPALRALRRHWPQARIVMLAGASAAPALADNPHLDRLLVVQDDVFFRPRPLRLLRLALALRRERFDLALLFSRSRALLRFARLAGARRVRGLTRRTAASADPDRAGYEVDHNLALVRELEVPEQGHELELSIPTSAGAQADALVAGKGRFVVMAPGGGENAGWSMPHKRWPAELFAALARALHDRGGVTTVAVGGSEDEALAAEIVRGAGPGVALSATGTPLAVSAAIIRRGILLVTNDSVAMHLGLVAETPFAALFGPTNPRAVLPRSGRFRVLRPQVPCSPCFWQEKPGLEASAGRGRFAPCPRFEVSCLEALPMESVLVAAESLLKQEADGRDASVAVPRAQ